MTNEMHVFVYVFQLKSIMKKYVMRNCYSFFLSIYFRCKFILLYKTSKYYPSIIYSRELLFEVVESFGCPKLHDVICRRPLMGPEPARSLYISIATFCFDNNMHTK